MFGALIKTYYAELNHLDPKDIVTVALMPCSAKKFECNRPEMCASGFKDIDYGLTTRELGKMIREAGLDLPKLAKSDFDAPFGTATGSGVIFGATGGVMEAALRTVLELVTGEKVEKFFDHADIVPLRGFEGVRYAEVPVTKVGPVPGLVQHLFPDWDWLLRRDLESGRLPRHGQRQEGDGGHPRRRPLQPMPFHRVHGLSGRVPGRRRAAHSHQPDASGPPGPGRSTPRTTPTPCGNRTRTRPSWRFTRSSSAAAPAGTRATNCCTRRIRGGGSILRENSEPGSQHIRLMVLPLISC